ncbi:MAG: hypothetical protein KatS3mg132_469 [Limisphaera sp.]|nr:MAG: hypothetical protein KatS3mg132_469 [Limisphaera sp.]
MAAEVQKVERRDRARLFEQEAASIGAEEGGGADTEAMHGRQAGRQMAGDWVACEKSSYHGIRLNVSDANWCFGKATGSDGPERCIEAEGLWCGYASTYV